MPIAGEQALAAAPADAKATDDAGEKPKPKRARPSRTTRAKSASSKGASDKLEPAVEAVSANGESKESPPKPKRARKKAATTSASPRKRSTSSATAKKDAEPSEGESDRSAVVDDSESSPAQASPTKSSSSRRRSRKKASTAEVVESERDEDKGLEDKGDGEQETTEERGTAKKASSSRRRRSSRSTGAARAESKSKRAKGAGTSASSEAEKLDDSAETEKRGSGTSRKSSRSRRSRAPAPRESLPSVRKEMIISVDVGEQRVAVIEDDTVVEVYLERRGGRSVAGSIYKGVVDNVLPGMEASFVDIGLERNGFLYVGEIVMPELEESGKKRGRRIQDLISRGQEVLVQAVKDPMGSKGARLTTEISLPGRFVVFVPYGDGIGISRRLDDDERERLKKLCKGLDLPEGGIIVRTAAEGVTEAELQGDLALLRKLWATILGRSSRAEAPTLVYREAELPLRLVRDLFIRDFERLVVDHEQTHRRLVGYLKRTSPELAARVELDAAAVSIMQRHGVDKALLSTLSRNVPLPSGGSLVFDYAEALTVVDVNTGRFVGGKGSKTSLEDTITANNLEAAREIVRQLRLRDIGGIIVIDFIDMANSRNRKAVETELARELGRDRTKTYAVEISPLGLVEMTRQNVTDGPREILTVACPTCAGDGIVLSEESVVIDVERALRSSALGSSAEGLLVELNERIARRVIGPGGDRLAEFEADVGRRVFVESRADVPLDYFEVLAEGTSAEMEHRGLPVAPGEKLELELEDVYLLDDADAIGRRDGYVLVVAGAGRRVGEKVQVVVDRVTRTVAYASLQTVLADTEPSETLTAEDAIGLDGATGELDDVELPAAKPTRELADGAEATGAGAGSDGASQDGAESEASEGPTKRRRRRRSSRKKTVEATSNGDSPNSDNDATESAESPDSSESETTPAPKSPSSRRRRRSSGGGKKAAASDVPANDAQPRADGDGDNDRANGKSEAPASAPAAGKPRPRKRAAVSEPASSEDGATDAEPTTNGDAPTKPRRRRRRSSRSKTAGTEATTASSGVATTEQPQLATGVTAVSGATESSESATSAKQPGGDGDAAAGDEAVAKKPARRRRSSSRSRRPSTAGAASESAATEAPTEATTGDSDA